MSLVPAQTQYPATAPQPQFIQELVAVMIPLIMLAVFSAWGISQIKKLFKGEEVPKPF
jgi:uncharacterized membrane protein YdbT with pleckstrin-like domain